MEKTAIYDEHTSEINSTKLIVCSCYRMQHMIMMMTKKGNFQTTP